MKIEDKVIIDNKYSYDMPSNYDSRAEMELISYLAENKKVGIIKQVTYENSSMDEKKFLVLFENIDLLHTGISEYLFSDMGKYLDEGVTLYRHELLYYVEYESDNNNTIRFKVR